MSGLSFLIDLTTSRMYKGHNPVGIVRTEREIGKALLATSHNVGFFYFEAASGKFFSIPRHEAVAILGEPQNQGHDLPERTPLKGSENLERNVAGDDDLQTFLQRVRSRLISQGTVGDPRDAHDILHERPLEFFAGDIVISAGLLWDGDYLELLYAEKQKTDLLFIQIVYDIVPVLIPEFCVPGMNVRFPKFLLDASWTADVLYCISDSTLQDVDSYLHKHKLPKPALQRIELGADLMKQKGTDSKPRSTLTPNNFVTYVSTIEPRKNHMMLFHVWRQLYQTDRDALVPLVIVGRQGWNSGDLINMMTASEHLYPDYIKLMTDVSDAELDWLYSNSRFTVYPSLYEGWGLPVAESLARSKFCIAAATSSIPEVAHDFAELIDPLDTIAWTNSIRHFLNEPQDVLAREKRMRDEYKPVSWAEAMERFTISVAQTVERVRAQRNVKY